MRDKPDGFDCFDDGDGDWDCDCEEGVSDLSECLLDVLVAGVGQARTGVAHRWLGNGGDVLVNDSLGNEPNKQFTSISNEKKKKCTVTKKFNQKDEAINDTLKLSVHK